MEEQQEQQQLSAELLSAKDAEQAVLARLLIDPAEIEKVIPILRDASMFGNPFYASVYKTMLALHAQNRSSDLVSVISENKDVQRTAVFEIISNIPDEISAVSVTSAMIVDHAKIVAEHYGKRVIANGIRDGKDMPSIIADIEKMQIKGIERFFDPKETAMQMLAAFEQRENTLAYPFTLLNRATGGIYKGQVVIVAARPSIGKSTFLENIGTTVAKTGKKVLFATAEMSAEMITLRMATRMTRKNMFIERQKKTEEQDRAEIDKAVNQIAAIGVNILEFNTVAQLEQTIKDRARDMDLILVDYLQLLEPKTKYRSIYEKITTVANELTQIAKKYNVPMIVACQYNRLAEKNIPTMADLKESGQIEQNADVIVSLWNNKDSDLRKEGDKIAKTVRVRVDLLKNRNGYTFLNRNAADDPKYFLWFNKPVFEFSDPLLTETY